MNIAESNLLIAQFMGGEVEIWNAKDRLGDDTENDATYVYFDGVGMVLQDELNYHENLDMLMEVIKRILEIEFTNETKFEINISSDGVSLHNTLTMVWFGYKVERGYSLEDRTIDTMLYDVVVQFINWYNKQ